jgi:hypothetical protein
VLRKGLLCGPKVLDNLWQLQESGSFAHQHLFLLR